MYPVSRPHVSSLKPFYYKVAGCRLEPCEHTWKGMSSARSQERNIIVSFHALKDETVPNSRPWMYVTAQYLYHCKVCELVFERE